MRRLLYVPVIHEEIDLGIAGAALSQKSAALVGAQRWATHQAAVDQFWASVAAYLRSFPVKQLKVYQDGLAAGGELGIRIVEEAAKRASKNYQLILEMLQRGAELRSTENAALLQQERQNILGEQGGASNGQDNSKEYRGRQDWLMRERDKFIAQTINGTLKEGEIGVLFIGAYHDVAAYLERDIATLQVRDPALVRAYFVELFGGQDDARLETLARHLTLG